MAVETVDQQMSYSKHMAGTGSTDLLSHKYMEADSAAAAAAMMEFDKLYLPTHHINSFLPGNSSTAPYQSMFQVREEVIE